MRWAARPTPLPGGARFRLAGGPVRLVSLDAARGEGDVDLARTVAEPAEDLDHRLDAETLANYAGLTDRQADVPARHVPRGPQPRRDRRGPRHHQVPGGPAPRVGDLEAPPGPGVTASQRAISAARALPMFEQAALKRKGDAKRKTGEHFPYLRPALARTPARSSRSATSRCSKPRPAPPRPAPAQRPPLQKGRGQTSPPNVGPQAPGSRIERLADPRTGRGSDPSLIPANLGACLFGVSIQTSFWLRVVLNKLRLLQKGADRFISSKEQNLALLAAHENVAEESGGQSEKGGREQPPSGDQRSFFCSAFDPGGDGPNQQDPKGHIERVKLGVLEMEAFSQRVTEGRFVVSDHTEGIP